MQATSATGAGAVARGAVAVAGARASSIRGVAALPARRASRALAPRRRVAPRRAAVAARASIGGEFPVFDVINDAVINAHASAMTSDALGSLFQVADAAAVDVEEIPGLQKGGWLGPITDFLEASLGVRVAVLSRTFGLAARPSVPRLGVGGRPRRVESRPEP